ncbi:MAG TPA: CpsD/CapB family tyrosine-protein kinase [Ktedonobacteraceae bacterium]
MQNQSKIDVVDTPTLSHAAAKPPTILPEPRKLQPLSRRDASVARLFQERCRQLNLSTFYQGNSQVRSLGFTSSINGEGKTFLASVTANLLANDSSQPVTLIECNWEHPSIHEYYGIPALPGIAEWLHHECREEDIRYQVSRNLTVIPAGNGRKDAVRLLEQIRQRGLLQVFAHKNDLLVVDLPSIATTAYGQIAASLLDSVILVVNTGVTPDGLVKEACAKLSNVPLQGVILNQLQSKIPRWLRQIL